MSRPSNLPDTIEVSWYIDDVRELRPDLTDAQAREVLQEGNRQHDATIGIDWNALAFHTDDLVPQHD